MFAFLDKIIDFLQKYWWAVVLGALVCWGATLLYFTLWPPESALDKQTRLRAGFLEPKQAKDLGEAEELLKTVNQDVRLLPRDVFPYRQIMYLLAQMGSGELSDEQKHELERKMGMTWRDIENNWIAETASLLGIPDQNRPKTLKECAELLKKKRTEIEQYNNEGFNKTLEDLLARLGRGEKGGILDEINRFLANDVVAVAKKRLILMGTPAVPIMTKILEENPSGNKGRQVYDVILSIIATRRLISLDSKDLDDVIPYLHVLAVQKAIGKGEFSEQDRSQLEKAKGRKWQDIEKEWLDQTVTVVSAVPNLAAQPRPKDLTEAAAQLANARKQIEERNTDAFNEISNSLIEDFGLEPDAKAIEGIKKWLDSPGNRELLGK